MGRWLPSQDLTMRAAGVGASSGVEEDMSRVMAGYCPRVIDKSFFLGLEQGKLGAPESKLLASAYSMASLSHW